MIIKITITPNNTDITIATIITALIELFFPIQTYSVS